MLSQNNPTENDKKLEETTKTTAIVPIEKDENSNNTMSTSTTTPTTTTSASCCCLDYSYLVLFAAFVAYMLSSLLATCFGVIFDSLENELGISRSKVALIGSLLSSLDNILGPVSSSIINRFGCRITTIIGGVLIALGVIGSAFTSEFWLLGLLLGGLSGLGSSLVTVSTVVVATYYFEDKPSFASGFVISGSSFGLTVFPLIIIKLNNIYGRSGCFLILAGAILNIIVCGALFRPLEWETESYEDDDDDEEEEITTIDDDVCDDSGVNSKLDVFDKAECVDGLCSSYVDITIPKQATTTTTETTIFQKLKAFFSKKSEKHTATVLSVDNRQYHRNHHHHYHHHRYSHHNVPNVHFPLTLRTYYYKSLLNLNTRLLANLSPTVLSFTSSPMETSVINLTSEDHSLSIPVDTTANKSLSCPNLTATPQQKGEMVTINDLNYRLKKYSNYIQNQLRQQQQQQANRLSSEQNDADISVSHRCSMSRVFASVLKYIKSSISETVKLFRIPEFTIFTISSFIVCSFYDAPFYFINSYMTENGFSENQAGIVNVSVGIAGIVASISYGYIGDLKRISWTLLYSISIFLAAVCQFALPLIITNYPLTMLCMILLSMFVTAADVLVPLVCMKLVGYDHFVSAYGLMFFCQGLSSLIGPPLLGMFVDYTGNYAYSYRIGGIGFCLSASILLIIWLKDKCKSKKNSKQQDVITS